jgi:hypothetical protein
LNISFCRILLQGNSSRQVVAGIGDPVHGLIKMPCRRRVPRPAPSIGQAKDIIPETWRPSGGRAASKRFAIGIAEARDP